MKNVNMMKEINIDSISSDALRYWMKAKGLTQVELERQSGVSQNYISLILSGKRVPSVSKLQELCGGLGGITLGEFFEQQETIPVDFLVVPKVKPLTTQEELIVDEEYQELYSFNMTFLKSRGNPYEMRLFEVVGDAMEPTFTEGDMVIADTSQCAIVSGKLYLLRIGNELVVKRAENRPGGVFFKSDNLKYKSMYVPRNSGFDLSICGRVIWLCRSC